MTTIHHLSDRQLAVRKGRGYVVVVYDARASQYRVPAGAAGTYLTRSEPDAIDYAAAFGAIRRDEDGRPARLRDIQADV